MKFNGGGQRGYIIKRGPNINRKSTFANFYEKKRRYFNCTEQKTMILTELNVYKKKAYETIVNKIDVTTHLPAIKVEWFLFCVNTDVFVVMAHKFQNEQF